MSRVLVWYSSGAPSAVTWDLAVKKYGPSVQAVKCNTAANENPDNARFDAEVERWVGGKITVLSSKKYAVIEEVFDKRKWMSGPDGAPCTTELKKIPRFDFQQPDDLHMFGFTADEERKSRLPDFEAANHDLRLEWILRDMGYTRQDCFRTLLKAGIEVPIMYRQGFKNNNCIGCVKASSPAYWRKVEILYPDIFKRRCEQSRRIGAKLVEVHGERVYLDELHLYPEAIGRYKGYEKILEDVSCGPECAPKARAA